jgi:hypothetical protein
LSLIFITLSPANSLRMGALVASKDDASASRI